jgi:hypothetical protein
MPPRHHITSVAYKVLVKFTQRSDGLVVILANMPYWQFEDPGSDPDELSWYFMVISSSGAQICISPQCHVMNFYYILKQNTVFARI